MMNTNRYLKEHQKMIYQIFCNALKSDQLSHAYLLLGEQGTPLLPIAKFLAQSLICDSPNPLACGECLSCIRLDEGNYADFMLIDGQEKIIKKDDIQILEQNFEKTAIENKGLMIYIINHIENITLEAINSLLKFLEEPGKNIYAFLTSENEIKIPPTILSRTQILRLRLVPTAKIIDEARSLGVNDEDAEILSFFYNDALLIQESAQNKNYLDAKELLFALLNSLNQDRYEAIYCMQHVVAPKIKSKESARFFVDILTFVLHEIMNISLKNTITLQSYDKILNDLSMKLSNIQEIYLEAMTIRGQIDMNVNINLLLEHLIIRITKGAKAYE